MRLTTSGGPALAVRDLQVSYLTPSGRATALWNAGFEIGHGECYGLVGESGCGKSTMAMAILRHLPPGGEIDGGRISLDGTDVLSLSQRELRELRGRKAAMVYQDPGTALNPSLTIGHQIAEVYRYQAGCSRAAANSAARDMLGEVLLRPPALFADRYPHQLSGGQQQRVVIAMALAARPRLLILDEPTTNLDATVEAEVLSLVMDLRRDFVDAVLFITHNLGLVNRMCDRVGVLYAGRVVEEGPAAEVLRSPSHPYTNALLRCVPRLTPTGELAPLRAIPGGLPKMGEQVAGCSFQPRCPLAGPRCAESEPSLDEVGPSRRVRCYFPGAAPLEEDGLTSRGLSAVGETLLEVRSLTKRYGSVEACSDVSLTVAAGEVVGLVGESGSGKTTLGRCIVGLSVPEAGEVIFGGVPLARSIARRSLRDVKSLQMVLQSPDSTLNPRHRVRRILRRAIRRLGGRSSAEDLAQMVRLETYNLSRRASELSGGLRQRVGIARAFAGQPSLVVCDEPVSSLDVSVQAAILDLLLRLQSDKATAYLFISHDLGVVRYLSHRIVVMYRGQVVESGKADAVFAPPYHPYTELLLSAIPSVDAPPGWGGSPDVQDADLPPNETGCRFFPRCHYGIPGLCDEEAPPLGDVGDGHMLRCHLPVRELLDKQLAGTRRSGNLARD